MCAIVHAIVLRHKDWAGGRLRLACDNTVVVDAINNQSIRGETIKPLQDILLVAAIFDIEISTFWIPSEENIVADAASRFDFEKLADLGFQASSQRYPDTATVSTLRQKLSTFFTTPSHHPQGNHTIPPASRMRPSVTTTNITHSPPPLDQLRIGSPQSCLESNPTRQKHISSHSGPLTLNKVSPPLSSTIHELTLSSGVESAVMEKGRSDSDSLSQPRSSVASSGKLETTTTASTSKQQSAWHLPPSFDLENLRGIIGHLRHPPSS
jgi:hypothetical protein